MNSAHIKPDKKILCATKFAKNFVRRRGREPACRQAGKVRSSSRIEGYSQLAARQNKKKFYFCRVNQLIAKPIEPRVLKRTLSEQSESNVCAVQGLNL